MRTHKPLVLPLKLTDSINNLDSAQMSAAVKTRDATVLSEVLALQKEVWNLEVGVDRFK